MQQQIKIANFFFLNSIIKYTLLKQIEKTQKGDIFKKSDKYIDNTNLKTNIDLT